MLLTDQRTDLADHSQTRDTRHWFINYYTVKFVFMPPLMFFPIAVTSRTTGPSPACRGCCEASLDHSACGQEMMYHTATYGSPAPIQSKFSMHHRYTDTLKFLLFLYKALIHCVALHIWIRWLTRIIRPAHSLHPHPLEPLMNQGPASNRRNSKGLAELSLGLFLASTLAPRRKPSKTFIYFQGSPKVLGLRWNHLEDKIHVTVHDSECEEANFKIHRVSLWSISIPLFPVLFPPKLFLQELWKHGYKWDQVPTPKEEEELLMGLNH